jgi:hypothetical protein
MRSLVYHNKKKIPCNRILKCIICDKIFKKKGDLLRHEKRKTSCMPIQGDPTKPIANNRTCHFCYKVLKTKYTLARHFKTCKIKNGKIHILFNKIDELEKDLSKTNQELMYYKKHSSHQTVNNYNYNQTFNFNIVGFNSFENQNKMRQILQDIMPEILTRDFIDEKSKKEQIHNRISEIVTSIHRNPKYREMQNIYVQSPRAFIFDPEFTPKWMADNWSCVFEMVLKKICHTTFLSDIYKDKKLDPNLIGHILQIHAGEHSADNANQTVDKKELLKKLGEELSFDSIN